MKKETIIVSVEVEIYDKREVIRAARARAKQEGHTLGRDFTAREAVQYLIDPGTLPGCEVEQSWESTP